LYTLRELNSTAIKFRGFRGFLNKSAKILVLLHPRNFQIMPIPRNFQIMPIREIKFPFF